MKNDYLRLYYYNPGMYLAIIVLFCLCALALVEIMFMMNEKCLTKIAKDFCESQDMSFSHLVRYDGFVCRGNVGNYKSGEFKFTEEEIKSCYERR